MRRCRIPAGLETTSELLKPVAIRCGEGWRLQAVENELACTLPSYRYRARWWQEDTLAANPRVRLVVDGVTAHKHPNALQRMKEPY